MKLTLLYPSPALYGKEGRCFFRSVESHAYYNVFDSIFSHHKLSYIMSIVLEHV